MCAAYSKEERNEARRKRDREIQQLMKTDTVDVTDSIGILIEKEYECDLDKSGSGNSPYGNRGKPEEPTTEGRRNMSHDSNNPISFVSGEQRNTGSDCFIGPVNAMNPSSSNVDQSNWEGSKGEWPTPHISEEADNTDYKELYAGVEFYDDVNGGPLRKDLMIEARKLEMQFFRKMGYILR